MPRPLSVYFTLHRCEGRRRHGRKSKRNLSQARYKWLIIKVLTLNSVRLLHPETRFSGNMASFLHSIELSEHPSDSIVTQQKCHINETGPPKAM